MLEGNTNANSVRNDKMEKANKSSKHYGIIANFLSAFYNLFIRIHASHCFHIVHPWRNGNWEVLFIVEVFYVCACPLNSGGKFCFFCRVIMYDIYLNCSHEYLFIL
jgi:hypothetical protein